MDLFYWHGLLPYSSYRVWKTKCGTNSSSDACNTLLNDLTLVRCLSRVLCCAVLCCAVLCCAVLCCAVLCCAVPPCI
jgi:hypothetical protein